MAADNMNGKPLGKQVGRMLQSLTSMIALITVSWMLKAMHVELLPYLALKAPPKMTIAVYCMIYQSDTYTET